MSAPLDWARDGRDWPNRKASRFVKAGGITWHVQVEGKGPVLLLLHGTGASTHSWRDLLPLLARDYRVIAPDLPGHGFTEMPRSDEISLPGMAKLLGLLVAELGEKPMDAVGHSAGCALLIRMALDGAINPHAIIGLNAALRPFGGGAGRAFSSLARFFALNPLVPHFFAWRANDAGAIRRLMEGTGSRIDQRGLDLYQRLFLSRAHLRSTIAMMANWDLVPLNEELGHLHASLHLIVAPGDRAISPEDARQLKRSHPTIHLHWLKEGGHLAHEENPLEIAALIHDIAKPVALRQTG
ncbi:MAG: alpha/beta fold hydrolase [Methylobacterium sp.]|nr:alpha/beta fold hydrolase [Methylobacterium sp.]